MIKGHESPSIDKNSFHLANLQLETLPSDRHFHFGLGNSDLGVCRPPPVFERSSRRLLLKMYTPGAHLMLDPACAMAVLQWADELHDLSKSRRKSSPWYVAPAL